MSSGKWRPSCLDLNILISQYYYGKYNVLGTYNHDFYQWLEWFTYKLANRVDTSLIWTAHKIVLSSPIWSLIEI